MPELSPDQDLCNIPAYLSTYATHPCDSDFPAARPLYSITNWFLGLPSSTLTSTDSPSPPPLPAQSSAPPAHSTAINLSQASPALAYSPH